VTLAFFKWCRWDNINIIHMYYILLLII
jgi:hypothetical protein